MDFPDHYLSATTQFDWMSHSDMFVNIDGSCVLIIFWCCVAHLQQEDKSIARLSSCLCCNTKQSINFQCWAIFFFLQTLFKNKGIRFLGFILKQYCLMCFCIKLISWDTIQGCATKQNSFWFEGLLIVVEYIAPISSFYKTDKLLIFKRFYEDLVCIMCRICIIIWYFV